MAIITRKKEMTREELMTKMGIMTITMILIKRRMTSWP